VKGKIYQILSERRIPWIIKSKFEALLNILIYYSNKYYSYKYKGKSALNNTVTFKCGFHGKSGGLYAIATIANMLVKNHNVKFITYPASNINSLLDKNIELVDKIIDDSALYILDVSCDHETYQRIRQSGKPIIVSCHGMFDSAHGLDQAYVRQSLALADITHFVNLVQQESFRIEMGKYVIIPNATRQIDKTIFTNNVGVVGNLDYENKNAKESVDIFMKSKAEVIHLWSGGKNISKSKRVILHQWENNKRKIYNSFDVLVFMGKKETFSLTVIEAMSAGIPCLISAIPAHEQYRNCPGVILVDEKNRSYAHELLNELLEKKSELRKQLIDYWEMNYSEKAVAKQWDFLIETVSSRIGKSHENAPLV
jgi:glycosyltransferase involved in cell wall biosynthesis